MSVQRTMAIISVALLVVGVVYDLAFYQTQIYQGNIAKDWLYRARATNDLHDMSLNLGRADTILTSFHGNPTWLFPTPETDFDQIRSNVEVDIATANSLVSNSSLSQFAYQQAVANLQETINEIATHLGDALGNIWLNPIINWAGVIVLTPLTFATAGTATIYWIDTLDI